MTNKNKSTREEKPEPTKPRHTALLQSEKEEYLEKLMKLYPKLPKPMLEMIIKVYEKDLYGTDEEKEHMQKIFDEMPKRPDLTYFGNNGFQPEITENKGFKIENNLNNIV